MSVFRSPQRMLRAGAFLSFAILGCAPPSASSRSTLVTRRQSEIPLAEIERDPTRFGTAYDIVRLLRPSMLVSRGVSTTRSQSRLSMRAADYGIKVYLDGIRYGGVESLSMIPASMVFEIRWLSAIEATTRYGTGNVAGAIEITSRNARR